MIINGKKVGSSKTFAVINPYTQKKIACVAKATSDQINEALTLSHELKPNSSAAYRSKVIDNTIKILRKEKNALAEIITSESGLCIQDTLKEIDRVIQVAFYSSIVTKIIDIDTTNKFVLDPKEGDPKLTVITEPLDLVAAITPFNHPMNQVAHKVFPAIAAGTPVVLKPSEKTPLSALKLGEILHRAGLENNMLNIITGDSISKVIDPIITSPLIDAVTFTGGVEAGYSIKQKMIESGNHLKKYISELGGSSSLIVNNDADLSLSAKVASQGCFKNSGQRCTAVRRIIVLDEVADSFVSLLVQRTKKIKYGDSYDTKTDMGTVISEEAAKMIEARVESAIIDGAQLKYGHIREGALYSPTVLDYVSIESELVSKETFGPVAPVLRVKNLREAILLANQTEYRLAGAVMTESFDIAKKVADALVVGQFNWNGVPGYRTEAAPFGGFKNSGNGEKEGVILATEGLRRIRTFYQHNV